MAAAEPEATAVTEARRRALVALAIALAALLALLALRAGGAGPAEWTPTSDGASSGSASGPSGSPSPHDAGVASRGADAGLSPRALRPVRLAAASVRRDGGATGSIAGHVVVFGREAEGVAGAQLTFVHGDRAVELTTAEDGSFLLASDALGTYRLAIAIADGFLPFAPAWGESPLRFELRPGQVVEGVVITLVPEISYAVTVLDADGPVAGAEVVVHGADVGERALAPLVGAARTDAAGIATVVAPDGAVIEARRGLARGRAAVDAAAQVTRRVEITLTSPPPELSGALTIEGRVIDEAGQAIAGASVVGVAERSSRSNVADLHPPLSSTSDVRGRFVLGHADAATYRLEVRHAGHATARARAEAGAREVEVVLHDGAVLRVHVVDAETGSSVVAASVVVERAIGPLVVEPLALGAGYDGEGIVEVDGLPLGPARVVAAAPGYAPSAPLEVTLGPGTSDVDVSLGRGATIVGRVTSADGTPLSGARVSLESRLEPGASAAPIEASVVSDDDGDFTLRGVPEGLRSIAVWAEGHHGRLRSGIVVTDGATTDVGRIDLLPLEPGETPRLELAGIGVVLEAEGDALVIGRVVDGGGAAAAGLVVGDGIVGIEGEPVAGLGFEACIERLRGPEGTVVTVLVRHAGGPEELVVVPRRRIRA